MAKALTINYNGKSYKAGYDRAAAKAYSRMGFTPADIIDKPFEATIPFVFCAFKKYQPAISQSKVEEIYDALAANVKPRFLTALANQYSEAVNGLLGDENADGGEGNATWENADEDE